MNVCYAATVTGSTPWRQENIGKVLDGFGQRVGDNVWLLYLTPGQFAKLSTIYPGEAHLFHYDGDPVLVEQFVSGQQITAIPWVTKVTKKKNGKN